MKRACLTNTNKYENISCEFHPTLEINYLRMKKNNLFLQRIRIIKRILVTLVLASLFNFLYSQPDAFTWFNKHYGRINPISDPKDQRDQGPCSVFASVAAVEAISAIYFNKNASNLFLSESSIYNRGIDLSCIGIACNGGSDVQTALNFIKNTGVIDNDSYPYPLTGNICRSDCQNIFNNYKTLIKIPKWDTLVLTNSNKLKKAIMDYGPIIVTMSTNTSNQFIGCALHPGNDCSFNHTVLIIGWREDPELQWHIKDSWPGSPSMNYVSTNNVDIFNYQPIFYRVRPVYNSMEISCQGDYCNDVFGSRYFEDFDKDGFYNWGMGPKPANCPGINKMDVDDGRKSIIFRDGYNIMTGPYISDTTSSKYICSNGKTFTLQNFDPLAQKGFTVSWDLTPAYYFSSYHGDTKTAVVTPYSSYYGKKCKIEYSLHKGDTLVTKYKFDFYINGPREDLVSISTLDSYGGSPTKYGDTYYLCPNTNYTITYNNYDNACQTSDFTWGLPYGWSKNWDYNYQVSINTNDNPSGFLRISAIASYCNQDIQVLEPYFGAADCGDYFILYPNPAESFVVIDVLKDKFTSEKISYDEDCTVIVLDKAGTSKNNVKFKGFPYTLDTSNLKEGLYFVNIQLNGKTSTFPLVIKPR
jgi:hypothetical protein